MQKSLTLSECAVLAAIPKAPTAYNPKNHPEKNQQRRDKILNNMKEQGYITEEEYTIAMNDNVYDRIAMHTQSQAESAPYSYFIDEVITNLINDLMVQKGYTEVQAKNVVYSGGLKIYTTQDSYMQSILDTEFQNPENFPANTQIGLDWALTVEQADGEVQNYSKEMLQLYFRNSDPNFDLLFDSQEEAQSYIDQYKAAIMQEGRYDCCRAQQLHPAAAGVHDRYGSAHWLRESHRRRTRRKKQQVLPSTAQPIIIPSRVPRQDSFRVRTGARPWKDYTRYGN